MMMVTFSASAEVTMASFSFMPEVVRLTVFTALCQA